MAYQRKVYHRDENCLNCGYPLIGNYCGQCGQKAHLHKDNFLHMVLHFVGDYFHYDNKFWLTLKTMFVSPGKITAEFIAGRRVKYLNPIQLYIFVTALSFLFLLGGSKKGNRKADPIQITTGDLQISKKDSLKMQSDSLYRDSLKQLVIENPKRGLTDLFSFENDCNSKEDYNKQQAALPENERNSWLQSFFIRKSFDLDKEYQSKDMINKIFMEKMTHNFPKVFFVLLPFFALLLKLVYIRKPFFYIDHVIFSLHFHAILFLVLDLQKLLSKILPKNSTAFVLLGVVAALSIYLFLSMRRVYNSSVVKTLIKQVLVFSVYGLGFVLMFIALLALTFAFL